MSVISCIPAIRHTRAFSWPTLALMLSACGGGDGSGVVTPPPPDNVAAKVEIVSPAETVRATETLQLSATVRNAAGVVLSGRTLSWQSASDAVASVTPSGLVTGNGPGSVTLTAIETASGRSGSMSLSVLPAPVATLAIAPTALSVQEGATQPLAATARDVNGNVLTGRAVVWSSADAAVATVDAATGVVRGMRAGASTTITAVSEGKSAVAEVTVTPVPVASLTIEPASVSLYPGDTRTLAITARDAAGNVLPGRAVTLVSSNASVATVSGGVVTAAGVGSATITASSEGRTASAAVTVSPVPVASLTLEPASISLHPGDTRTLAITARDAAGNVLPGRAVTLVSSNASVATVSGGVVTAAGVGSATITASSEGRTASAAVTVSPVPVASLTMEPASMWLHPGDTRALAITARDAAGNVLPGRAVSLVSSTASVATVSGGVVTAVGTGMATLTATSEGKTATTSVTVTPVPVASLAIEPASVSLYVGGTRGLAITARDAAGNVLPGRTVNLSSSNNAVATVSGSVVTAVGVGSATLTATNESGHSATAAVTVTLAPIASLTLEPASVSLRVGATQTLAAVAWDAAGIVLPGRAVTLVSSDAAVATVSGNVVTAAGVGSATITASAEGKTATTSVSVTAVPVASVTLEPASISLHVGFSMSPSVIARDSAGNWLVRPATLVSSDPSVAVVDRGTVRGVGVGTATLTATSEGKSASSSITVTAAPVASLTVSPDALSMGEGEAHSLTVEARDAAGNSLSGRAVTLVSSNAAVATVSGNVVTAAGEGSATITATCEGKTATVSVVVRPEPVTAVFISPDGATLKPGAARQLTATASGERSRTITGRAVSWASLDPAVAAVNASGLVTGVAEGRTTVTATIEGVSATATITVGEAARVEVSPSFAVMNVGAGMSLTSVATTASGMILPVPAQYTSLNSDIVRVFEYGPAIADSAGLARIVGRVDAARDTLLIAALGHRSLLSTAFVDDRYEVDVSGGQTVTLPVVLDLSKVSRQGDLGAAQFELNYDPAVLVYQSASAEVPGTTNFDVPAPGTFRFSFAGNSLLGAARLTLVRITFRIAPGTPVGTMRAVNLTYTAQPASTTSEKYSLPISAGGRIRVVP